MVIFYGCVTMKQNVAAGYLYGLTDVIQYMLATIGCLSALWKMRLLKFNETSGSNDDSQLRDQTLLDHILLSLGLIGELMFSASGILGIAAERTWQLLTLILIAMHFTRLVQAVIQAVLIYIAGKLSAHGDDELRRSLPGKQAVMFLLVANISMFLMKLFEAEKTGDSEAVINFYGKRNWAFLVRSFIPLAIFYRFHSSVCLAEIWKSVYASKDV